MPQRNPATTFGQTSPYKGIAARGTLYGATLGLVLGMSYLVMAVAFVYLGPLIGELLNPQVGGGMPITLEFAVGTALGGLVVGVLPATVLGALTGLLIGALRQRSRSPWSGRRTWLTGTVVCSVPAVLAAVLLGTLFAPELLWTLPGTLLYTVPLLIFIAPGGPFATWLQQRYVRPGGAR